MKRKLSATWAFALYLSKLFEKEKLWVRFTVDGIAPDEEDRESVGRQVRRLRKLGYLKRVGTICQGKPVRIAIYAPTALLRKTKDFTLISRID